MTSPSSHLVLTIATWGGLDHRDSTGWSHVLLLLSSCLFSFQSSLPLSRPCWLTEPARSGRDQERHPSLTFGLHTHGCSHTSTTHINRELRNYGTERLKPCSCWPSVQTQVCLMLELITLIVSIRMIVAVKLEDSPASGLNKWDLPGCTLRRPEMEGGGLIYELLCHCCACQHSFTNILKCQVLN